MYDNAILGCIKIDRGWSGERVPSRATAFGRKQTSGVANDAPNQIGLRFFTTRYTPRRSPHTPTSRKRGASQKLLPGLAVASLDHGFPAAWTCWGRA